MAFENRAMPSSASHPRDPLHGITLESIINQLVQRIRLNEHVPFSVPDALHPGIYCCLSRKNRFPPGGALVALLLTMVPR